MPKATPVTSARRSGKAQVKPEEELITSVTKTPETVVDDEGFEEEDDDEGFEEEEVASKPRKRSFIIITTEEEEEDSSGLPESVLLKLTGTPEKKAFFELKNDLFGGLLRASEIAVKAILTLHQIKSAENDGYVVMAVPKDREAQVVALLSKK